MIVAASRPKAATWNILRIKNLEIQKLSGVKASVANFTVDVLAGKAVSAISVTLM